jgi:hypothetical protein
VGARSAHKRLAGGSALLLLGAALALVPPSGAGAPGARAHPLATCFWEGPISTKRHSTRGFNGRYFNFPEESATYWMARFELPAGSKLMLRGRYPHGRYMSLNSYSEGEPTDTLSDIGIRPNRGSVNPFIPGHRRDLPNRSWRVTVLDQQPPAAGAARARNTIYAQPELGAPIELFYRVYEPDRGLDLTGGTELPRQAVRLADGSVLGGAAACRAVNDPDRQIPVDTTPEMQWETARATPGCDPETNPAYEPTRWERFFNYEYAALGVLTDCTQAGREARHAMTPELRGGNYSNRDSAYIFAHLSRDFGPLVVLRGKLPVVPRTLAGQRVMGGGQMRFWSLCTGESRVTTFTPDCLADRQVPTDRNRSYTIVVSRRGDRPANARRRCGVGWLRWGERGDGVGDRDYGLLIMRNMLVSPRFARAIQRVEQPGTEQQVMGPYFPRTSYATKSAFESRGC